MRSVIILTAVLGIGILSWMLMRVDSADLPCPVVRFVESKGRGVDRIAVFAVTNTASRKAIWIGDVQVQVAEDAGWRTISQQEFRVWTFLEQAPKHFPQLLEAGAHRMFSVDWPAAQSWRANVEYRREAEGIEALAVKARIMWATRSMLPLRGRASVDPQWAASVEVRDSSRTPSLYRMTAPRRCPAIRESRTDRHR